MNIQIGIGSFEASISFKASDNSKPSSQTWLAVLFGKGKKDCLEKHKLRLLHSIMLVI